MASKQSTAHSRIPPMESKKRRRIEEPNPEMGKRNKQQQIRREKDDAGSQSTKKSDQKRSPSNISASRKEASTTNSNTYVATKGNQIASSRAETGRPSKGKMIEFSDDEGDRPTAPQALSSTKLTPSHASFLNAQPRDQKPPAAPSSLLDKYRKKLEGAKFRMLNESLYTGEKQSTGLSRREFAVYHQGFARQVEKWPTNPVDEIIRRYINPKKRKISIGDFGCGDAKIAHLKGKQHRIHSFDLVAADESVIACDIAKDGVPLGDESLDMVIFSLSLMGSDVTSYIVEARRVLRVGGELIIAEVKSRFSDEGEKSVEAFNRGLNKFCNGLKGNGFKIVDLDSESNTHFVLIRLSKSSQLVNKEVRITLKACEYKRR